jgi:4-amino-4-deoxy-L-arabinose transferase-like glycosyltransferase
VPTKHLAPDIAVYAVLAFLVLVGLGMRAWLATTLPFWLDEAFTWREIHHSYFEILTWQHHSEHPPLAYVMAKAMFDISSHKEWLMRAPFVLLGGVNIVLAFRLGAALKGRFCGLLAAMLLAFSPFLTQLDFQARMYSPWVSAMFLIVLAYRQLYLQTGGAINWRLAGFLWLGLALSLAFWINVMTLYLWGAVGVALLWEFCRLFREKGFSLEVIAAVQCGILLALVVMVVCWPGVSRLLTLEAAGKPIDLSVHRLYLVWKEFLSNTYVPVTLGAVVAGLVFLPARDRALRDFLLLGLLTGSAFLILSQNRHFIAARYLAPLAVPVVLGLATLGTACYTHLMKSGRWLGRAFALLVALIGAQQLTQSLGMIENRQVSAYAGNLYSARFVKALRPDVGENDTAIFLPQFQKQVAIFYGWPTEEINNSKGHRALRENLHAPRNAIWILSFEDFKSRPGVEYYRKYLGTRLRCSLGKELPEEFISNLTQFRSIAFRLFGQSVVAYSLMNNGDLVKTRCVLDS